MAKKEEKVNYQEIDVNELRNRLDKTRGELFKVRFRSAASTLTNTMQIRKLRREVARINTFINQRSSSQSGSVSEVKHKNGRSNG